MMTSKRVAGVLVTLWIHSAWESWNSRGGRMAFRMSSVCFVDVVAPEAAVPAREDFVYVWD